MFVILAFLATAAAYPANLNCDFACMGNYMPGSSFGYMGVANVGNETGTNCVVTTDIPSSGPMAGENYTVTVTSTTKLAQKVVASSGNFGSDGMVSNAGKVMSQAHTWTAGDSSVTFRVLCGSSQEMWYADAMVGATTTATTTTAVSGAPATAMIRAAAIVPLFALLGV